MPSTDYERFRQRLERQLRADVELIFEAYQAKLRAFETVARARGELEEGASPPPLSRPARLLELGPAPSAPAVAEPAEGQVTPPSAPSAAPAASKRPRHYAYEVYDAVEKALAQVGDVFDRHDLCRVLGFVPSRATLHRVLVELEEAGAIALQEVGVGSRASRYRKRAPAPATANTRTAS